MDRDHEAGLRDKAEPAATEEYGRRSISPHVWVDLSNSPHVPFFSPIVRRLRAYGLEVTLTARNFAQTVEMAEREFGALAVVGRWGRGSMAKAAAVATRAIELGRFARQRRFDLAVSHNSYAQILAAKALRIPTMTLMDYEHQPANHLAFRLADVVMVPTVFPDRDLRRLGARHVVRYPGLKEEIYLASSASSGDLRSELGLSDGEVLAVLRPPPDFAAYHRFDNPVFAAAVDRVLLCPSAVGLLLPRTSEQADWAVKRWGHRLRIPDTVLPGVDLLNAADLVVGAGGTMNRESALLGTPTYSLFAGSPSAVDAALVDRGALTLVNDADDLDRIEVKRKAEKPQVLLSDRQDAVLGTIVDTILRQLDNPRYRWPRGRGWSPGEQR